MVVKFLVRNRHIIIYGTSLALLLFLLKWLELRFIIINHSFEIYIGGIAVIFTCLGIWLALKLVKPRVQTVVLEKEVYLPAAENKTNGNAGFEPNQKEISTLGLSKREMEVLQLMATGLSNREIALQLYVSLNTIKTHTSRVFEKMDVKRRTQAIEKAKRSGLIP